MSNKQLVGERATKVPSQDLPGNVIEIYPGATERPAMVQPQQADSEKGQRPGVSYLARLGSEVGMATAEYAIATLAAVGFAGLLVVILKSNEVRGFLMNIIRTALSM